MPLPPLHFGRGPNKVGVNIAKKKKSRKRFNVLNKITILRSECVTALECLITLYFIQFQNNLFFGNKK